MIKINLMPKPKKRETVRVLKIQASAARKLVLFHDDRLINAQRKVIESQEVLLRLYGVYL